MSDEPNVVQAPQGTSQQVQEPWAEQKPYLVEAFAKAKSQLDQPISYYPNQTYANPSPETSLAYNTMSSQAQNNLANGGSPLAKQSLNTIANLSTGNDIASTVGKLQSAGIGKYDPTMGGILSDENMNQYRSSLQNAAQVGINKQLPMVRSQFTGSGGSGGTLEQQAIGQLGADAYTQAEAGLLRDKMGIQAAGYTAAQQQLPSALQSQQDVTGRAATLLPGMETSTLQQPLNDLLTTGQYREGLANQQIQDDMSRYNFAQTIDRQKLADYLAAISGGYGGTNVTTGAQPFTTAPNSTWSGLGNILGAGAIASSIYNDNMWGGV